MFLWKESLISIENSTHYFYMMPFTVFTNTFNKIYRYFVLLRTIIAGLLAHSQLSISSLWPLMRIKQKRCLSETVTQDGCLSFTLNFSFWRNESEAILKWGHSDSREMTGCQVWNNLTSTEAWQTHFLQTFRRICLRSPSWQVTLSHSLQLPAMAQTTAMN